jgi:hypothetical protein
MANTTVKFNLMRPNGEALSMEASLDWQVTRLKHEIEKESAVPHELQRLLYNETTLEDSELLSRYFVDGAADVLLVCQALELADWKKAQLNVERWREILAYSQRASAQGGLVSQLRVAAHHLWGLGPLEDADWQDREFVRKAAKEEVSLLALASPDLTSDRAFTLEEIKRFGGAINFVSPELQTDWDFVLTAVRTNFFAAQSIHRDLLADTQFVQAVLKIGPVVQHMIPRPLAALD